MKIVFESKEEKAQFWNSVLGPNFACPHKIGCVSDWDFCVPSTERCKHCWEKHVKMEVEQ